MKQSHRLLAAVLGVMLPIAASAAGNGGQLLALVIGNGAYVSLPALPTCAASAHVVSAALRRSGFSVTERLDVSNGEMGAAITGFGQALVAAPDSGAVLYVCGYAIDFDGRDFLLPASASIDRETDALTQGLAAKSVLDAIVRSGPRAALVLLDAAAPLRGGPTLRFDQLARTAPPSFGFAAAVGAGPMPDGPTAFAASLAAALAPPQLDAAAVLRAVAARLAGNAGTILALAAPPGPLWLAGGPQPVQPSPAVTAPVPRASAPSPAAPLLAAAMPDEEHMMEADRRRIQSALLRLGYYDHQVDGVFGAETRAAIRRFQHEIGVDMTGRITPEQSARLLVGAR